MSNTLRALPATAAVAAATAILAAGPADADADADETKSAKLTCGSAQLEVTGFGRGQVLFVTGTTQRFIVTFAQLTDTGNVVFEAPGQSTDDSVVTCTVTSPVTGRSFIFRGFFTPRA